MKTFSHDAIVVAYKGDPHLSTCESCGGDIRNHTWVTMNECGTVVECSNKKKHLTDSTGVG